MKIKEFLALAPEKKPMILRLDFSCSMLGNLNSADILAVTQGLSMVTSLNKIDLSHNMLDLLGHSQLVELANALASIRTLAKLNLSSNAMQHWRPQSLEAFWVNLAKCHNLTTLDVANNQIGAMLSHDEYDSHEGDPNKAEATIKAFNAFLNALDQFKKLESLNLSGNYLGPLLIYWFDEHYIDNYDDIRFITKFIDIINTYGALTCLNLSGNTLCEIARVDGMHTDEGTQLITWMPFCAALAQLPALQTLDLSNNDLADQCDANEFSVLISQLSKSKLLSQLNLSRNNLYTLDIRLHCKILAALNKMHLLTEIDLSFTFFVSDEAKFNTVLHLLTYLSGHGATLYHINLSHNKLDRLPQPALQALCTVLGKYLRVESINLSKTGLRRLDNSRLIILIDMLAGWSSLKKIDFQRNHFDHWDINLFTAFCHGLARCQSLYSIDLGDVSILDENHTLALTESLTQCKFLLQIHNNLEPQSVAREMLKSICKEHHFELSSQMMTTKQLLFFKQLPAELHQPVLSYAFPNVPQDLIKGIDKSVSKLIRERSSKNQYATFADGQEPETKKLKM